MPVLPASVYDPLSLICDVIEVEGSVVHNVVMKVKARLDMQSRFLEKLPKCRVEVWAEDSAWDGRGSDDRELAYCKGNIFLGDSKARVAWLGRSKGRPVRSDVAGRLCVSGSKGTSACRSIATAIFGLFAAIAQMFRVTDLELLADDHGGGGLLRFYHTLGFTESLNEPGQAIFMKGTTQNVSQFVPDEWFRKLLPADFDGTRWLGRHKDMMRRSTSQNTLKAEDRLANICSRRSSSAVRRPSSSVLRYDPKSCEKLLLERCDRKLSKAPVIAPYTVQQVEDVKDELDAVFAAAKRHIEELLESSALPRRRIESATRARTPSGAKQQSPTRRPSSGTGTMPALDFAQTAYSTGTVPASGSAFGRSRSKKRPVSAAGTEDILSLSTAPTQKQAVVPFLPRPVVPAPLPPTRAPTESIVSADWQWSAGWPAGAIVHLKIRPGKTHEQLRADVVLRSSDGVELAFARGAIPPKRQFLRVLWLGRTACQPVHQSIRGQAMHKIESGGQVTPAVALLGVLASVAVLLNVEVVSLQHLDSGSGILRRYLCGLGFLEAEDDALSMDRNAQSWLTVPPAALAQRCCPCTWQTELQQQSNADISFSQHAQQRPAEQSPDVASTEPRLAPLMIR